MSTRADLVNAAAASGRAALVWLTPAGRLDAATVTPLRFRDTIAFALAFDRTPLARALSSARAAALAVNDDRLVSTGWTPMVGSVDLDVVEDRDGAWLANGLLDQELRRYPPARQLIDTPILRREHWWYVPRWIVSVTGARGVRPVEPVMGPCGGVVAVADAGSILLASATVDPASRRLSGMPPGFADGVVLFHGHGAAGPGLERTGEWTLWYTVAAPEDTPSQRGETSGQPDARGAASPDLRVLDERGAPTLRDPDSLVARLRRHWRLQRRCRLALEGRTIAAEGEPD